MESTGKQFAEFWTWAAQKGLMNENTAYGFSSPVRKILSVDEGWENMNVTKLDVDDILQRFQNIHGKEFKPESLNAYFRRFRQALSLYLQYVDNPTAWKYKGQQSSTRKQKPKKADKNQHTDDAFEMPITQGSASTQMVDYPFPLRENCIVRLKLPTDLKTNEVERLATFMRTLVTDFDLKRSPKCL